MFKPVETSPRATPRRWRAANCQPLVRTAAMAMALALWVPLLAMAGITPADTPEAARQPVMPAADKAPKEPGTYQIRCWQQGRLLFEENHVALPADTAKYGIKMNGTDRNGKPLYVADTANATCLIRAVEDERAWRR